MGKLKAQYVIQRKVGKGSKWEITHWNQGDDSLEGCKVGIAIAREHYPNDEYRIGKIIRHLEVINF